MFKSSAGYEGLPSNSEISGGNAYLYGLSDFWTFMFEDVELVERMLEQQSVQMAEVYSKFLQLTSTVSLEDVQAYTGSEIKLFTILDRADWIEGTTYRIPEGFITCKYLLSRPILPTVTMERGVHFDIDPDALTITFYTQLENSGAPVRQVLDPENEALNDFEYALWATDVVTDEDLVFRYYGQYVGFDNEKHSAAETYKNFIKGLYFLYVNGPVIRYMEQGLSLALGVPIAREDEKVLSVVREAESNSHLVVTANNSYRIPYDIAPDIDLDDPEKDHIVKGAPLLKVAQISDHTKDGDWWNNIPIPFELVEKINGRQYGPVSPYGEEPGPDDPDPVTSLIIASNDPNAGEEQKEMYFLMDTFLKTHAFFIKLIWQPSAADSGVQSEVLKLVSTAKPTYTVSIQIWELPLGMEVLTLEDELNDHFQMSAEYRFFDYMGHAEQFYERDVNIGAWEATTAYERIDVVVPNSEVPGNETIEIEARCKTSGTTSGVELDWPNLSPGDTVTDGTAVWRIRNKKSGGVNSEKDEAFFIKSNSDPTLITVDEVNITYAVPARFNFPDVDTPVNVPDGDIIPLYNATTGELRAKFGMLNVDLGTCIPKIFTLSGFDGTQAYAQVITTPILGTYVESIFIRNYQEYEDKYGAGFVGKGYNDGALSVPTLEGEVYRAYFPDTLDISSNESIFVMNVDGDMYSVFWIKSGGVASFPEIYFEVPTTENLQVHTIPAPGSGTSVMSPAYANTDLEYSNNNLTVSWGED